MAFSILGLPASSDSKERNEMLSERGRYCVLWLLRTFSSVCMINESTFQTFPFNVFEPSNNIAFHVLLFLRFMRPNSQAMCVWIKRTWESLFMSDPRKFPLSCLSEVHAESMMGRWSPPSAGKIWNLLSFPFHWTENKLTDPQVYL